MGKIGVYLCECGPNIADRVDLDRAIEELSAIQGVEVVEKHRLPCSAAGKEFVKNNIRENGITHVVVGACSHKQHEGTFMKVCEETGVNPYLLQLVNLREQCAWVTPDKNEATEKAIRCMRSAISRVRYHAALEKKEIDANPDVLVIGGGITGIHASLVLASKDRKVYLVEKTPNLGGVAVQFERLYQDPKTHTIIKDRIEHVHASDQIEIFTESEVQDVIGFFGNFVVNIKSPKGDVEVNVGAVVLATGYTLFDPQKVPKYGYGKIDDIYTALEFEQMNARGKIVLKNGTPPASVGLVHCVGREELGYCSKICCAYVSKFSQYLTEKIPDVKIHKLYYDLCIHDHEKDVNPIQISDVDDIIEKNGTRVITYQTENGKQERVETDMVILLPGIEPGSDTPTLAEILNIVQDEQGFFAEEHVKLSVISTSLEGIFIAGCAQGPNDVYESISQAEAAAGKIFSSLVPGRKLEPEVMTSKIADILCTGCQTCLSVCAYSAISYDELRGVCAVNEVLCRGCGNCASACPSNAITHKHFTSRQIYQELIEALQ
jgi:heterodisulfide reductase subunit A